MGSFTKSRVMRVAGVSVASAFTLDGLTTDGGRNGGMEQALRPKINGMSTILRSGSVLKVKVKERNI
jgi:hypothetical protein